MVPGRCAESSVVHACRLKTIGTFNSESDDARGDNIISVALLRLLSGALLASSRTAISLSSHARVIVLHSHHTWVNREGSSGLQTSCPRKRKIRGI